MAIQVICPGCHKRFKVGDQFAGRTGPCPACKHPIQIPEKGKEVKVHAPEQFESGGRSTSGKLVLKPISYRQMKTDPIVLAIVIGVVVVMLATAWAAGSVFCRQFVDSLGGVNGDFSDYRLRRLFLSPQ